MKALSLLLIVLCFACGTAPRSPEKGSVKQSDAMGAIAQPDSETPSKLSMDEEKARQIIEQVTSTPDLEAPAADTPADVPVNTASAPSDFMDVTQQKVSQAFASAQNKKGQKLSADQVQAMTQSFMAVVAAAQSKKPLQVAAAWNAFTGLTKKMNQEARSKAAALNASGDGLIQDIVDLAQDILDLVPDLVIAVLHLDVLGVIDVAVDLITLLIDFLI